MCMCCVTGTEMWFEPEVFIHTTLLVMHMTYKFDWKLALTLLHSGLKHWNILVVSHFITLDTL